MGDVQLPLKLSAAYFISISISTAASEENIRYPTSTASPLSFSFCNPPCKLLKLFSFSSRRRKPHATDSGDAISTPKKADRSRKWRFFLKRKASENGSSSSRNDVSLGSSGTGDGGGGDGIGSVAYQNSPPEKPSPSSAISPSSVLEKNLYVDGNSNEEDGVDKITRFDASESSTSHDDLEELQDEVSSRIIDKRTKNDEAFESFASNHVPLSSFLVSTLDSPEDGKETVPGGISQYKEQMKPGKSKTLDDSLKDEKEPETTSSWNGNALTSLRPNARSDILQNEAGNARERNITAISDSEAEADDSRYSEVTQSDMLEMVSQASEESKENEACERQPNKSHDPHLVMRQAEKASPGSFSLLKSKLMHGISSSIGLSSMARRMHSNKRAALSAVSRLTFKKQQQQQRENGACLGRDELWNKKILMGKRCQEPRGDDCRPSADGAEVWKKKILMGSRCRCDNIPGNGGGVAEPGEDEVDGSYFDAEKEVEKDGSTLSCKELMQLEAEHFNNAVPFKGFGFSPSVQKS